jgi:hypothetical protein
MYRYKNRERREGERGYLTGGRHELELHVDIKIERGGKRKGLFVRRQAKIGVAWRYKDRERGEEERAIWQEAGTNWSCM